MGKKTRDRTSRRAAERKRRKERKRKERENERRRNDRVLLGVGSGLLSMMPPEALAEAEQNREAVRARAMARLARGGDEAKPPSGYRVVEEGGLWRVAWTTDDGEEFGCGVWDAVELAVDAAWEISAGREPFSLEELAAASQAG